MTNVVPMPPRQSAEIVRFDPTDTEQLRLVRELLTTGEGPSALTDDEFALYVRVASHTGLDPFKRQVYAIKRRDQHARGGWKLSVQTGIDGYRAIAARTGQHAGTDDAVFVGLSRDKQNPGAATVTVYKMIGGVRAPFTATARWDEYKPPDNQDAMWKKMPHNQLAKCAEALALRKAFPEELAGVDAEEAILYSAAERTVDFDPAVEKSREELLAERYTALPLTDKVDFQAWVTRRRAECVAADPESTGFARPYDDATLDEMEALLDSNLPIPADDETSDTDPKTVSADVTPPAACDVCGDPSTMTVGDEHYCRDHEPPPDAR